MRTFFAIIICIVREKNRRKEILDYIQCKLNKSFLKRNCRLYFGSEMSISTNLSVDKNKLCF